MPARVTVTGTAGAGLAVTAVVFNDVSSFLIDTDKNMITMYKDNGETVSPISVAAATTVTATKAGNVWTLVIS